MAVEIITGDCRTELGTLEAESIHCCVTSPPYWGLRDYGVDGGIGLEQTVDEYIQQIVNVFTRVKRVLRDDGTLWVNMGDLYIGGRSGGAGSSSKLNGSHRNHTAARKAWRAHGNGTHRQVGNLKPKDLVGLPWRVAFALQADGWWLRSDIIWHKPSPMPESVTDRPTKAHEYIFLLSKSVRYHYDADAIKEQVTGNAHPRGTGVNPKAGKNEQTGDRRKAGFNERWRTKQNASFSAAVTDLVETRNKRTIWTVASQPFPGAHFATFPPKLIEPCIKAGCPAGGTVLDPFGGAGTTGLVADRLGRNAVLIELNPEYAEMARRRIKGDAPLFADVNVRDKA